MALYETQVLTDTPYRYCLKLINSGTSQTDVVAVNGASLSYATQLLTTDASVNNFIIGETVNAAAGGSAVVQDVINSTAVMLISVSGTFTTAQNVTGATSGKIRVQNGSVAAANVDFTVAKILYNVGGAGLQDQVQLSWQGNGGGANNRVIAILTGDGVFEFDSLASRIPNNANVATGNILVSTLNFVANSHYSLVLDLSKKRGFAAPTEPRG